MEMERSYKGMRSDHSIQQRVIQDQKMLDNALYDQKMKNLGIYSGWFEKNQKYAVSNAKKMGDKRIRNELTLTNQEIKMRRRVRLHELYVVEYGLYEEELNKMGLSIVKEL